MQGAFLQKEAYILSSFCPSDGKNAEFEMSLILAFCVDVAPSHDGLATGDDGGSRGAYVINDEKMLSCQG